MAIRSQDSEISHDEQSLYDSRIKVIEPSRNDKNQESDVIYDETAAKVKKHMFDKSWRTIRHLIWGTFVFMLCVVAIHIIQNPYFIVNEWVAVAAIGTIVAQSYPLFNIIKFMTS